MMDTCFHKGIGPVFYMRLLGRRQALRISPAETTLMVSRRPVMTAGKNGCGNDGGNEWCAGGAKRGDNGGRDPRRIQSLFDFVFISFVGVVADGVSLLREWIVITRKPISCTGLYSNTGAAPGFFGHQEFRT